MNQRSESLYNLLQNKNSERQNLKQKKKSPEFKVSSFLVKSSSQKVLNSDGHGNEHKFFYYPLFSQNEQKILVSIYKLSMFCLHLVRTGLRPQAYALGLN